MKLFRKFHFSIRKDSTKFHIEVRKPHFKLRKALFEKGLDRNCKYKKCVLEFDVEKDGRIISANLFKKKRLSFIALIFYI